MLGLKWQYRLLHIYVVFLCCACKVTAHEYSRELRDLLGRDLQGAKIVAVRRGTHITTLDLNRLKIRKLARYEPREDVDGLSRPYWSPDGKQILFSYKAKAWLMDEDGDNLREILSGGGTVYEPLFWVDPETHDWCVVFKDDNRKNNLTRDCVWGRTWLAMLRTGTVKQLFDMPCDGGISLDGTHLGEAYARGAIVDLVQDKIYKVDDKQTCNGSMSPDNTYRLMYLYITHDRFGIRDKYRKELWTFAMPEGSDFITTPRWSNHPDFCTAVVRYGTDFKIVVIQISTGKSVILKNLKASWNVPLLWLPSGRERMNMAAASNRMTKEQAKQTLSQIESIVDVEKAASLCSEILDLFPGTDLAERASAFLDSDEFGKQQGANEVLKQLLSTTALLVPVSGCNARFSDAGYFKRNRPLLVYMVRLVKRIKDDFEGTYAFKEAGRIAELYGLPEHTDIPITETLELSATVEAVSRVPSAAEISPYRESLTFIKYRIEAVHQGEYYGERIVVAHWGMKDANHTAAAGWRPGMRQRLKVDRLDAHPELRKITFAADAADVSLIPFWTLDVEVIED